MTYNFLGLGSVILSVAAFAAIYSYLMDKPVRLRLIALLVFSILAIPSILFAVYYLHILPEKAWFYTLRSFRGSELLVVFLGLAAGSFAALLPRLLLGLPLFGLILIGVVPYLKPLLSPLPDDALKETWKGDVCQQSTFATCGPASVCTILRSFAIESTEREAARAAFTYSGGTEAWYLARYVRDKGLEPEFVFTRTFSPEAGLPAMVGVRIGGMGHFVVVLSIKDDMVTFADPLGELETLPLQSFRNRYQFTAFRMVVKSS